MKSFFSLLNTIRGLRSGGQSLTNSDVRILLIYWSSFQEKCFYFVVTKNAHLAKKKKRRNQLQFHSNEEEAITREHFYKPTIVLHVRCILWYSKVRRINWRRHQKYVSWKIYLSFNLQITTPTLCLLPHDPIQIFVSNKLQGMIPDADLECNHPTVS